MSSVLKSLDRWIARYLVWASPLILAIVIWGSVSSDLEIRTSGTPAVAWIWEGLSWNLMLWLALLLVFLVRLAFRDETQEFALKRLAGITERDEREEVFVGAAARRSFLATSGLLVFLLFLSCFTVSIAKIPPEQIVDGRKSMLKIGFRLVGLEPRAVTPSASTAPTGDSVIFDHQDIPITKSGLILMVLVWQLTTFRVQFRRENRLS